MQTGVKSFGCEKSTAHESPIQSWKRIRPSVESASKSGAVTPIVSALDSSFRRVRVSHHNGARRSAIRLWHAHGMDDTQIHERIETLVAEEHELYDRVGEGGLNADEHNRLESLKVSLDQCWDLLRQRRALRESGQDPDAAHARDPEIVERYEQ